MIDALEAMTASVDKATKALAIMADVVQEQRIEIERLRAALIVARRYVLVQTCELSLTPTDAASDLVQIDAALSPLSAPPAEGGMTDEPMYPTPELRFIERDKLMTPPDELHYVYRQRILQQKWSNHCVGDERTEWRDVPLVLGGDA